MLVNECPDERIPYDIDYADDKEHYGCHFRSKSVDVGVEKEQVHAYGPVDQILGEVAGAESDPLEP